MPRHAPRPTAAPPAPTTSPDSLANDHAPSDSASKVSASLFQRGLAAALQDIGQGRADLRAAAAQPRSAADPHSALLAAAALTLAQGIADDDYTGFEAMVAVVLAGQDQI